MTHHVRRLALTAGLVLGLTLPGDAAASAARFGTTTIALDGPAAQALRAQGVRFLALGRELRAPRRLSLRVRAGTVGRQVTLAHSGSLTLRARRGGRTRTLRVGDLRVRLTAARSTVSATVRGRRGTLLTIARRPRPRVDAATKVVVLRRAALTLTASGAATLRRALGLRRVAAGRLGSVSIDATLRGAPAPGGPAGPGQATPPTSGSPVPGGGTTSPPLPAEPSLLARPATAVPIVAATVVWNVRDSFIQYIAGGGGGATALAGATAGAPEVRPGTTTPLVYGFGFPPAATGWYDAPSDRAAVYFTGAVRFVYPGRFDFVAHDPEIEINAAASRAIFRFSGSGASAFDDRRGVLVDLRPLPAPAISGGTRTYTAIPGVIPAGAATSVFGDFYVPGDAFGSFSVSFSSG